MLPGKINISNEMGDIVMQNIQRREFITKGSAAIAGLAALYATRQAYAAKK